MNKFSFRSFWQAFGIGNKPISKHPFKKPPEEKEVKGVIPPGRVSVPNDSSTLNILKGLTEMVDPSFRVELIQLIRDLYKVNPDMGIALQDMFKLGNTGHRILFPNNTPEEATKMRQHLTKVSKNWTTYTAGTDGLINKMIVQLLVGGAISVEAVPKNDLSGVSTIVFINPEDVVFRRLNDGRYHPYQRNHSFSKTTEPYIKLNLATYKYCGMFNDTDEPYGVPPFLTALDSLKEQSDMKINMKHIMELMGFFGFLQAKMEKPSRRADESEAAYEKRLIKTLRDLKQNMREGMKDGLVTGYIDDHEFNMISTTQNLSNIDKVWNLNQQSVANGLSVNGNIIGVQTSTTEGGANMVLSKMISQLKNIQMLLSNVMQFIYSLELLMAGFNNKGCKVEFNSSTVTDELKYQQSQEYKIRNYVSLYNQGIISQEDFAFVMGYIKPDQKEPRVPLDSSGDVNDSAKKKSREDDKDKSDRKTRDKNNPNPRRKDGDTKER